MNAIETLRKLARSSTKPEPAFYSLCDDTDFPALLAEVERLQAVVDKLPKTADGVPITPDIPVFVVVGLETYESKVAIRVDWQKKAMPLYCYEQAMNCALDECYSTREAAEAAAKEERNKNPQREASLAVTTNE